MELELVPCRRSPLAFVHFFSEETLAFCVPFPEAEFLIQGLIFTRFTEISIPFDKIHRSQYTLSKSSIPTPAFQEMEMMIPMGPFQLGIFHGSMILQVSELCWPTFPLHFIKCN